MPKIVPVGLENLRNFVNGKIQELDSNNFNYRKNDISLLKIEYQSILEEFKTGLTKSGLESFVNHQIDSLVEEEKAERSQKRLSKCTKQLYSQLRRFYNDARYEFGLRRIRNL